MTIAVRDGSADTADWKRLFLAWMDQPGVAPNPSRIEALFLDALYQFMRTHPAQMQAAWDTIHATPAASAPFASSPPATWLSFDDDGVKPPPSVIAVPADALQPVHSWPVDIDPTEEEEVAPESWASTQPSTVQPHPLRAPGGAAAESRALPLTGSRWDASPDGPPLRGRRAADLLRQPGIWDVDEADIAPAGLVQAPLWPAPLALEIYSSNAMPVQRFTKTETGSQPFATPTATVTVFLDTEARHYYGVANGMLEAVPGVGNCLYEAVLVSLPAAQRLAIERVALAASTKPSLYLRQRAADALINDAHFAPFLTTDAPLEPEQKRAKCIDSGLTL
jgi:hypothetical protein